MAISVYLPEIMETKIRALVKVGVYPDESGVVNSDSDLKKLCTKI